MSTATVTLPQTAAEFAQLWDKTGLLPKRCTFLSDDGLEACLLGALSTYLTGDYWAGVNKNIEGYGSPFQYGLEAGFENWNIDPDFYSSFNNQQSYRNGHAIGAEVAELVGVG